MNFSLDNPEFLSLLPYSGINENIKNQGIQTSAIISDGEVPRLKPIISQDYQSFVDGINNEFNIFTPLPFLQTDNNDQLAIVNHLREMATANSPKPKVVEYMINSNITTVKYEFDNGILNFGKLTESGKYKTNLRFHVPSNYILLYIPLGSAICTITPIDAVDDGYASFIITKIDPDEDCKIQFKLFKINKTKFSDSKEYKKIRTQWNSEVSGLWTSTVAELGYPLILTCSRKRDKPTINGFYNQERDISINCDVNYIVKRNFCSLGESVAFMFDKKDSITNKYAVIPQLNGYVFSSLVYQRLKKPMKFLYRTLNDFKVVAKKIKKNPELIPLIAQAPAKRWTTITTSEMFSNKDDNGVLRLFNSYITLYNAIYGFGKTSDTLGSKQFEKKRSHDSDLSDEPLEKKVKSDDKNSPAL